jgi:hypothetical protein
MIRMKAIPPISVTPSQFQVSFGITMDDCRYEGSLISRFGDKSPFSPIIASL